MGYRLMAVHAHPDDESSKGAASAAMYASKGVSVRVVTLTGGERGDILNPAMDVPGVKENLPAIRREEMAKAAAILGVEHVWLGFVDSGLPEGDPLPALPEGSFALVPLEIPVAKLVAQIREFKPQVLTTYDEIGGYPHPDHIRTHVVSLAAVQAAADPTQFPEAGAPWQVSKVYYSHGFLRGKFLKFAAEFEARGEEPPFKEILGHLDKRSGPDNRVTTRIECAEFFPTRDDALRAHATQIDPNGPFFAIPMEWQQRAWPTEDFELAITSVPTTYPESDLFAGIEEAG